MRCNFASDRSSRFLVYSSIFSSASSTTKERAVVNVGETKKQIIVNLKQQGFIKSEWGFGEVLKIKNWENKIQPGACMVQNKRRMAISFCFNKNSPTKNGS